MKNHIEEEIETNDPKSFIPKFEDLMIEPEMVLFDKDEQYNADPLGASTKPLNHMRELAVICATEPTYSHELNRSQLNEIGYMYNDIYSSTLRFHILELVYNNIVLALHNSAPLVNTGFLEASNIREIIYNQLYEVGGADVHTSYILNNMAALHYKLFKATDNSRYVIKPELNRDNKNYDPVSKEGLIQELYVLGDLYVRNLYTSVMFAVDYACDAFFYNFGCVINPDLVEKVVDKFIEVIDANHYNDGTPANSPFTVTNKFVYCNMMIKGIISNMIGQLFGDKLNCIICSIFSVDERAIPSDIFNSLADIIRLEEMNANPSIKPTKVTPVRPDLDADEVEVHF